MKSKIKILNNIIENKQYFSDGFIMIDYNTAVMINEVVQNLSEKNQKKLLKCEWSVIQNVCFKLLKK